MMQENLSPDEFYLAMLKRIRRARRAKKLAPATVATLQIMAGMLQWQESGGSMTRSELVAAIRLAEQGKSMASAFGPAWALILSVFDADFAPKDYRDVA